MDTLAAVAAPRLVELDPGTLGSFLATGRLRVVQTYREERPFGLLLKSLLHGALGSTLRCGRLDLSRLGAGGLHAEMLAQWIDLAGIQGSVTPPPGYYLLRGRSLLGYHPGEEIGGGDWQGMAAVGVRGVVGWARTRDGQEAGRLALQGRDELDLLRFFQEAATGTIPRRARAAGDRRRGQDRRGNARMGKGRRSDEILLAELDRACAILGVKKDAPLREIKRARNRLMRANHPDRLVEHPERMAAATRVTVQINEAWSVIEEAREGPRTA
jgi:hypothetical protein